MSGSDRADVWPPGHPRIEDARTMFRNRMTRFYNGWDDNYDRQFDDHSFLFVLQDGGGDYLATCRLVFKRMRGRSHSLAMELADLSSFAPSGDFTRSCEGGMVSFVSRHAALDLMYGVTIWLIENDVDLCLTTYDVKNPMMQRLYTQTLQFSPIEGAIVRYSGFTRKEDGEPAAWQVLQATRPTAQAVLDGLVAAGVAPYQLDRTCPRLEDWL